MRRAFILGLILFVFSVERFEGQAWLQQTVTGGPPPQATSTAVADPSSNRLILYGGLGPGMSHSDEVWALTNADGSGAGGSQWLKLVATGTPGAPPSRHRHTAVYDAANNRMIVFGGCGGGCAPVLNDVWVLTNANGVGGTPEWEQLSPDGAAPVARNRHAATYDPVTNTMIIYGGQDGSANEDATFGDVWILTNANGLGGTSTWVQLSPAGGPPQGQSGASAAYDSIANTLMLFGGWGSGSPTNAVWTLSNANGTGGSPTWTNVIAEGAPGSPTARALAFAAYDPSFNRMAIFGGCGTAACNSANDLWVLTNANGIGGSPAWTQVLPSGLTSPYADPVGAGYMPAARRMVVFELDAWANVWVITEAMGTPADLLLGMTVSADPALLGSSLSYTLTVFNNGPADAANVIVTDTLPPEVSLNAATPAQGTCSGSNPLVCTLGTVAGGGSASVSVNVTTMQAGAISNTATISSGTPDNDPSNNTASLVSTVMFATPSLTSISPTTAAAGAAGFVLVANGSGFVPGSTVLWNGYPKPTSFVSANQLTANIAAFDLLVPGRAQVTIANPSPGGGISGPVSLTVAGIRITSPAGSEAWTTASSHSLSWSYFGSVGSTVSLQLLKSGIVRQVVASSVAVGTNGTGSYSWSIPTSLVSGADYAVRVNGSGKFTATSNLFSIVRPQIVVVSPNGGEVWPPGSTQTIQWSYAGSVGSVVSIQLLNNGALSRTIAASTSIGSNGKGSFSWVIPSTQAQSSTYKIKVASTTSSQYNDLSDTNFSIMPASLTVASPNGGETWLPGNTPAITWTYGGPAGTSVEIDLMKAGVLNRVIATGVPLGSAGAGSYNGWTVPQDQALGTDYKIKVVSNTGVNDTSNAVFYIGQFYALTVNKTGTGSAAGSVTSAPSGISCGATCTTPYAAGTPVTLTATPPAGGTFNGWTGACTGKGACQVTVNGPASVAADFTAPPTGIFLSSPVGGESWSAGTSHKISWNYYGSVGSTVSIKLYKAGTLLQTLSSATSIGTSGAGSFTWNTPSTQAGGTDYTITVASTTNTSYKSTSNAFTVVGPRITILSPNGGEVWVPGWQYVCQWTYTGNIGSAVSIQLLNDGVAKTLVSSISVGTGGAGSYKWTVPASQAPGTNYKLKITSLTNTTYTDQSDANFTIMPASVSVTSPNGGEVWLPGQSPAVNWTYSGPAGTTVEIDLLKSGTTNAVIATGIPIGSSGTGSYNGWTVPDSQTYGTDYTVKVVTNTGVNDTSNAAFSIGPFYTVTVNKTGTGAAAGTVTTSPPGINCGATCTAVYPGGTLMLVRATAPGGGVFNGWSGACTGKDIICQLNVNAAKTVTADFTAGPPSNSELNGHYAFLMSGYSPGGFVSVVGSIEADGQGNITSGMVDINQGGTVTSDTFTGTYWIGADHRGKVTINTVDVPLTFAVVTNSLSSGVASAGRIIGYESSGWVAGEFKKQDTATFSTSAISGNFAFGLFGNNVSGSRFVEAGRMSLNGTGTISSGIFDYNDGGAGGTATFSGTYSVLSSGRGTLTTTSSLSATLSHSVFYVISATEAYILPTDGPNLAGYAAKQSGTFSNASLNGVAVNMSTGRSKNCPTGSRAAAGLLTFNGAGSLTTSFDINDCAVPSTITKSDTYSASSNGRVTTSGGAILYLVAARKGYSIGLGTAVEFGTFEPQSGAPFSNSSVSGGRTFGVVGPVQPDGLAEVGVVTLAAGAYTSVVDDNHQGFTTTGATVGTYSVSSKGRVTTGEGDSIWYLVSPTRAFSINLTRTSPHASVSNIVGGVLAITTESLPNGMLNAPYASGVQYSGGTGTVTWSIVAGALPPGFTLDASTGQITGTPAGAQTANFTVQIRDATAATAQRALSIQIATMPLEITTPSLDGGWVGTKYTRNLQAAGGSSPYTWQITSGSVPPGLSLTGNSIRGTPTTQGTFNLTVTVSDSGSPKQVVQEDFSIAIDAAFALAPGDYAFEYDGWDLVSAQRVTAVGHFRLDGDGNITDGIEDINSGTGVVLSVPFTGVYAVFANRTGIFAINSTGPAAYWRVSIEASGLQGVFVRSDMVGPTVYWGGGRFIRQDDAAFSLSALAGDYVLGTWGTLQETDQVATIGRFTQSTSGVLSSGAADAIDKDGSYTGLTLTGSFGAPSPTTGRGTATLTLTPAPTGENGTYNFIYYAVDVNTVMLVQTDARSAAVPVLSGYAIRQSGVYSDASLNTPFIFNMNGSLAGSEGPFLSSIVGKISPDTSGGLSGTWDQNEQSALDLNHSFNGTYSVSANGRSTMTLDPAGTAKNIIAYLYAPNEGLMFQTGDPFALVGTFKPQAGGPLNAASIAGDYVMSNAPPMNTWSDIVAGILAWDGAGRLAGDIFYAVNGGMTPRVLTGGYSVDTNGRVLTTITSNGNTVPLVFWVVRPGELVGIDTTSPSDSLPIVSHLRR